MLVLLASPGIGRCCAYHYLQLHQNIFWVSGHRKSVGSIQKGGEMHSKRWTENTGAISQTRSWSHLHQMIKAGEGSFRGFSKTLFYLPGRYHECCQESLRHAQRESERVLPHDYEIDQGQYYNAVDCKAADERESLSATSSDLSLVFNQILK